MKVVRWTRTSTGERAGYVQAEEDEDIRPDARLVGQGVHAERLERGQDDKDGRPAVVEGEGEVYPELIVQ